MQSLVRLLILGVLVAIVASLGSALFHLSRGGGGDDSRRLARALTVRIVLSLVLFALLMLAWYLGFISPHGLAPPAHP
ncbi:MAG TPA: twin transmembrane helix small protein [Steroidobacteraceae bacterium]|jgi:membrane associated rhomboid family serine protease